MPARPASLACDHRRPALAVSTRSPTSSGTSLRGCCILALAGPTAPISSSVEADNHERLRADRRDIALRNLVRALARQAAAEHVWNRRCQESDGR